MIKNINFLKVQMPQTSSYKPAFRAVSNDTFTKSVNSYEETLSAARKKIIDVIQKDNVEYGILISEDGKILAENQGEESHCHIDNCRITENSTLTHGHPKPYPLSSQDIALLLSTPAKTIEAITVDGKYSRLTKKTQHNTVSNKVNIYYELEKKLRTKVLDKIGIDYKLNRDDLISMFEDFCIKTMGQEKHFESLEEATEVAEKFGINLTDENLETPYNKMKESMYYQLLFNPYKYDKVHNKIVEYNEMIDNYLATEEGIKTMDETIKEIAEEYNLEYETNLFE